jgi:hypothetical protein
MQNHGRVDGGSFGQCQNNNWSDSNANQCKLDNIQVSKILFRLFVNSSFSSFIPKPPSGPLTYHLG